MLIRPNDRTRDLVAQSYPVMKRNQDALIDGIAAYLRSADPETSSEDTGLVAMMLVGLMLDQAAQLVHSGTLPQPEDILREHQALGIQGRHYSRFGDALVSVIRDTVGSRMPGEVSSAWVDSFWSMIRVLQSSRIAADT